MFDAILKYDWNNIKHYVLIDSLDAETAALTEAYLIKKWRTYRIKKKGKTGRGRYVGSGYNSMIPKVVFPDDWAPPKIKKQEVDDVYEKSTEERYRSFLEYDALEHGRKVKKVRLIETGKVYESIREAAFCAETSVNGVYGAIHKGYATGYYYYCGKHNEDGIYDPNTCEVAKFDIFDVPKNYEIIRDDRAHWEYV